jgi:succinate dehydrogenase/fumarate reductase flavoprotein subunit
MATPSGSYDLVILGSGIAGLAGALAAHELGLQPVVLEKAAALGGGTVHSYGLIWIGQNHLARDAEIADSRDEVLAYMRFLGGGASTRLGWKHLSPVRLRYLNSLRIAESVSSWCAA